jgi:cell wall-associated NlpC family hydrolase
MHPSVPSEPRPARGARALLSLVLVLAAAVLGVAFVGGTAGAAASSDTMLVQRDLNGIGYNAGTVDGVQGPQTTAAVKAFQHDTAITADGVAGATTTSALKGKVGQVQQVAGSSPDGDFGPNTTAAVKAWQTAHGLTADGIAATNTMAAMRITRVVVTGGTSAAKIERVIAVSNTQIGKGITYAWDGGNRFGPTYGVCCSPAGFDDRGRFGFDCSGLMQYIFWQGTGVDVGDWSGAQYGKATKVPVAERQRGDMLFWGDGTDTTHVALFLGGGQMIEADSPRNSTSVHQTSVRTSGLMPFAVRIFA